METIPAVFWMIVVLGVAIMLCLVLYHLAMLIKEAKNTVIQTNKVIEETKVTVNRTNEILTDTKDIVADAKDMVSDARDIVTTAKVTSNAVSTTVMEPVREIGSTLSAISSFISAIRGNR
ncbi:hypothetical protein J6Z48_01115 [bacterium]|nr:hypothetical protein [bacterium]